MRFIRDIIKDKRNTTAADTAAEIEDVSAEPLAPADAAVNPEPESFDDAGYATGLPDDHLEMGLETSDIPSANLSEPGAEISPDSDALSHEPEADDIKLFEEASEGFEPPVTLDGQTQRDPFEKLRDTQEFDGATNPSARRVSALGRVKPKMPKAAATKPAPETMAQAQPVDALTPLADAMEQGSVEMPAPAAGRGSSRSGRVKTRLLGFSAGAVEQDDPFEKNAQRDGTFPVGWLVVISDKGRGASFALHDGVSTIGRGTDQTVSLNFGDNSISRDNHVSIAFDSEQNKFFVGHSGKTNLVRVNDLPLLSTEELRSKDLIRLGETTLRFIAFCAEDFGWDMQEEQVIRHA